MIERFKEVIKKVAKYSSLEFNIMKTSEEMGELNIEICRMITKQEIPDKQAIIDEMGDVILRISILAEQLSISEEDILKRIEHKTDDLSRHLISKKYKNI